MRAAVLEQFNQPWTLKNVADPKAGPGQVVIKIEASGMCGTDMHVHHGYLPVKPPIVCGHEPVGKVVELGAGVTSLRVGDRVGVSWMQKGCGRCHECQAGRPLYCPDQLSWMNIGGGNAELMLAYAEGCTLVPDGVSPESAAPIFCAGYTVMSGIHNAELRPGERVAVLGIGGLGHLAIQFAHALGFEVVAVTGTESKKKEALGFGADSVVVSGDDVGKALAAAGGVDVVLSTSNSAKQVTQAMDGLRGGGRLVSMGITDGPIVFNSMAAIKQLKLIGSSQDERCDLTEALALVARGKVKPMLESYKLSDVNEVRDRLGAGKVRYRAVMAIQ